MSNLIEAIDRATAGLCPCGAQPADGSAYCSDDCRPTHISGDTDIREAGHLATPMRWRPDLVTEVDDSDLIPLGTEILGYRGRFHAQLFERRSNPTVWHLRLDDGHRFVGCDLDDVGGRQDPITDELVARVRDAWQRLELELINPRRVEPTTAAPCALPADWIARMRAATVQLVTGSDLPPAAPALDTSLFTWTRRCRACHLRSLPTPGHRVRPSDPARIYGIGELATYPFDDIEDCDLCAHCRTPFSGPALAAVIYDPEGAGSVQFGIVARLALYATANGERYKWGRQVTEHELIVPACSPRETVERIWDEMEAALLRLIDNEQHAETSEALAYDCVEAGRLAHQAISEYFAGASAVRGVPPTSVHFGVPVVLVEDLAPQAWRLIDLNGSVVGEGHIAADVTPQPANRVFFAPTGTDPTSPVDNGQWTELTGYLTSDGLREEVGAAYRDAHEGVRVHRRDDGSWVAVT